MLVRQKLLDWYQTCKFELELILKEIGLFCRTQKIKIAELELEFELKKIYNQI